MLYGLGGGVGGGYFLFRYTGTPPVAVIGTRHLWQDGTAFLTGILARLAVAHRVTEAGSRKAADSRLDAILDAGQPALAWVDEATLPYRGLPEELRKFIVRIVGVAGRDPESGQILLDDRAAAPIPIDAAVFSEARGLITSNRRRLLAIEGPGEGVDLAATVREAILDGHRARTEPRIRNFGLPAFAKWADQIVDPKDPKAWPTALAGDVDLVRVLRWAHGAVGDGADRGVHAVFLDEAAEVLGRPGLVQVADRYRALADAWNELGAALLPDAIPSLGEIRSLELARRAAFDDPAGPDLDRFVELTRRIEADEMRQMRAMLSGESIDSAGPATFVVPADVRPTLFADLAARIREIHAAEVAATIALEAAVA
jgi:hypothetical protein